MYTQNQKTLFNDNKGAEGRSPVGSVQIQKNCFPGYTFTI